jgi:DNA-binding transcriptional MocR family regulator
MKFGTTEVLLSTGVRNELSQELNMSTGSITNNLKALKDLNLISGEKGVFTINPQIFWKGDEKARKAFMCEQEIKIKFSI